MRLLAAAASDNDSSRGTKRGLDSRDEGGGESDDVSGGDCDGGGDGDAHALRRFGRALLASHREAVEEGLTLASLRQPLLPAAPTPEAPGAGAVQSAIESSWDGAWVRPAVRAYLHGRAVASL